MRTPILLVLGTLLAGCEISTHVVQAGRDTYMVSSHVGACVRCSARIKSLETANKYCAKQGKLAIVRTTSGATNPFGYDNGNDMTFSCLSPDDPEYTRPTLRPDNGVTTIETR
jgi:hypothetical protein